MLKSIAAGLTVAVLLSPALAQTNERPGQGSVPRLDGVQTPGRGMDNQPGSGPLGSSYQASFGTNPRLDGVQTPGPGSDNQTGSGPLNTGAGPAPRRVGAPLLGAGPGQCAKDIYTYNAPSGSNGSGMAIWQTNRLVYEDWERRMGICTTTTARAVQVGAPSTDTPQQTATPNRAARR